MTSDDIMEYVRAALEDDEGAVFLYRRQPGGLQCIAFGDAELLEDLMGDVDGTRH